MELCFTWFDWTFLKVSDSDLYKLQLVTVALKHL